MAAQADDLRVNGATAIFVAVDGKAAGGLGVSDPVKAGAPDAIKALKAAGLRLVMIPGYNRATAEAVARGLGIDEVHAEVLPQDKAAVDARLRTDGRVVAMVGDGGQRWAGARGG